VLKPSTRQGAFVISLDFELHWGVFDHVTVPDAPYCRNLHGEWQAVPAMLALLKEFEISATWATVGLLFANNKEEQLRFRPKVLPTYRNNRLDPYVVAVGENENDDPLHFAPSLIRRIEETPRQEISTHTFAHYYCLEEGSTPEAFRADLSSAISIAEARGRHIESIVLPRNQVNGAYLPILRELGIHTYRGNEQGWMYAAADSAEAGRKAARLCRLADAYVNISGQNLTQWSECIDRDGMVNVRSTRFLRPYSRRGRRAESLRLRRITRGIEEAAAANRIYHLWWHPHNFGTELDANLAFLRQILAVVARCRESHGLQSLTMAEIGKVLRGQVAIRYTHGDRLGNRGVPPRSQTETLTEIGELYAGESGCDY
jgi:peptidoglycan/xylan/chitin deacetylase (PgdA/CDA1 family)